MPRSRVLNKPSPMYLSRGALTILRKAVMHPPRQGGNRNIFALVTLLNLKVLSAGGGF